MADHSKTKQKASQIANDRYSGVCFTLGYCKTVNRFSAKCLTLHDIKPWPVKLNNLEGTLEHETLQLQLKQDLFNGKINLTNLSSLRSARFEGVWHS